jgi:hypothetical protein
MTVRPALLAAAALAALGTALALGRGGKPDLPGLARVVEHGQELDSHVEAARRRDEAKRGLAAEVVAGRMTVPEAADQLRRLDEAASGDPPRRPGREQALRREVLDRAWALLRDQRRYAAAARWYAATFAAHPDLLPGPPTGHRFHTACAAVQAGCGKGDGAGLDAVSRAGLRRQALGWLRQELAAQRRRVAADPEEARRFPFGGLGRWLWDPDFIGFNLADILAGMPEGERQAWQKLWAEVRDTLARAEGTTPPEPKAGDKIPLRER